MRWLGLWSQCAKLNQSYSGRASETTSTHQSIGMESGSCQGPFWVPQSYSYRVFESGEVVRITQQFFALLKPSEGVFWSLPLGLGQPENNASVEASISFSVCMYV